MMGGMTTPLTTAANVATILGTAPGDTAQAPLVAIYLNEATQAICDWCEVADFGLRTVTEIGSGSNDPAIVLREMPVQGLTLTGSTTSGSTAITGLPTSGTPSTANLFVNQSVFGPGIPAGAILAAVNASAGTATLSLPATATASSVSLAFGIALWQDDNANGGSAYGSFAAGTLLIEGQDYWVDYTAGPGSQCSSALVYKANSYWSRPYVWVGGLVTPQYGPPTGNIKVQYTAGYATVPAALQAACEMLISNMKASKAFGRMASSMSRDGLSVSLGGDNKMGLLTPEITSLLARYKKIVLG